MVTPASRKLDLFFAGLLGQTKRRLSFEKSRRIQRRNLEMASYIETRDCSGSRITLGELRRNLSSIVRDE